MDLTYVHLLAGVLYYLKFLLTHFKGDFSYKDLRKVYRVIYPIFQHVYKTFSLLRDNKECDKAFYEAITTTISIYLRQLFMSIIVFCEAILALNAWWNFTYFRATFNTPNLWMSFNELNNYVLYKLELLFNISVTSLKEHQLSMPDG